MKKADVIDKMKAGCKLFRMKTFIPAGNSLSLTKKIDRGKDRVYYFFEDNTSVHHMIAKSLAKDRVIEPGDSERTLGGTRTEMKLKEIK